METKELNSFEIAWAFITPLKGKITKRDLNLIYKCGIYTIGGHMKETFIAHFPSKKNGIEKMKLVNGLYKEYSVVFITDKQFGIRKWNEPLGNIATEKQISESFIIK
jgi:hypothetical protein